MATLVLVDVEAYGASPINGEMTEFGAVALNADNTAVRDTFHGVLVTAQPSETNPAVPNVRDDAQRFDRCEVMARFQEWLFGLDDRVIFVSDNNGFDAMWITCEFDRCGLVNPFGHSSRRISDFWAGVNHSWRRSQNWKKLRQTPHDHNPVNDSLGNAEALIAIFSLLEPGRELKL